VPVRSGVGPGFAVIDVETTGLDVEDGRIVEVGVVVLGPTGSEAGSFSTLVHPGRDPGPTHVHGITGAMLVGAPTFGQVLPCLAGLLSGRVVVGHNVDRFDLAFLRAEFLRAGSDMPPVEDLVTVDTLEVAQRHLGLQGRARLVDCCGRYGLEWADHHSALGDARVTACLLTAMRGEVGDAVLGIGGMLTRATTVTWPDGSPLPPPVHGRAGLLAG
jgi:DNA polymerase-3 subunit epsilon